jgi:diaminopimelate epimerase
MRFTKMHGIGNDYVYVDRSTEVVIDPEARARKVSDRHFGIGADGLILIGPGKDADVSMRIFNADGSEAQMCGNGIRCVAKYAFDHGLSRANPMRVETAAGVKTLDLALDADGKVAAATVDMGEPVLYSQAIPVNLPLERVVDEPVRTSRGDFKMTCVSMGNPHAVIFVEDVAAVALESLGPELENHALFPQRINVHFVQVHCREELVSAVGELNTRKQELRLALNPVVSREQQIAGLRSEYETEAVELHRVDEQVGAQTRVLTTERTELARLRQADAKVAVGARGKPRSGRKKR